MKPWCETLALPEPLQDVRLVRVVPAHVAREAEQRQLIQESYERGRIEGEKALSEQLVRQRTDLLEIQNGIFNQLRNLIPELCRRYERGLVELALEVATKLVAGLSISREMIEAAVGEALSEVEDTTDLTIEIHPDDLQLLKEANSPALLPGGLDDRLRFEARPEMSRGGCRIHTRFGVVDARRETKVELLKKAVAA